MSKKPPLKTHFTEEEGLCFNSVMSIVEDSNNNIWISTDRGLNHFVFERERNSDVFYNPKIFTYGLQDGLKNIG